MEELVERRPFEQGAAAQAFEQDAARGVDVRRLRKGLVDDPGLLGEDTGTTSIRRGVAPLPLEDGDGVRREVPGNLDAGGPLEVFEEQAVGRRARCSSPRP